MIFEKTFKRNLMLKKDSIDCEKCTKKLKMNEEHKGGIVFDKGLLHFLGWHYKLYW